MNGTREEQAIEVEVVEIDGAAPPIRVERQVQPQGPDWRDWQRRIRTLDGRWWPLWVFLWAIALVLLLTLGVVVGVVFLIFKIVGGTLRAILG